MSIPTNSQAALRKDIRHHAGWCKDAAIAGYDKCPHEAWLPEREEQLDAIMAAVDECVRGVIGEDEDPLDHIVTDDLQEDGSHYSDSLTDRANERNELRAEQRKAAGL